LPLSARGERLDRGAAAGGRRGSKPVVRTVMTLTLVGALHRGDRVAGVDRALEGVGAIDLGDVAICATSSLAATRGATFLPRRWPGTGCGCSPAIASTCAATFSARPCSKRGASASSTLARRRSARGLAAPRRWPGDQHVHVAAAWQRAVTVLSVAPLTARCRVRQ
jgi:hypothetical protein